MPRKQKCWSHATGGKGSTVTVYEREPGGLLYARAYDPTLRMGKGGYRRVSLGHQDRERAKTYALEQAAKLRQGRNELAESKVTLAWVFSLYEAHRTPRKTAGEQSEDRRRIDMWTRVLGAHKDPHLISLGEWEGFIDARSSGTLNQRGVPVPEEKRELVRARTVEADCAWLRQVLNWAAKWRMGNGAYLMRENPLRGFDVPEEKNPRRPVATTDRYEAIRAVSDRVMMEVRWDGHRHEQRSYLSELLDIAYGTGRRIGAVCRLRYQDYDSNALPHGAIQWPGETDKMGKEWWAPISPTVRAAMDRILAERPGIGAAYLFPSPQTPTRPIRNELASGWLVRAERLAGVPKQGGSLWHAYRRGWVTARKHLPDVDVAAAGGWKDITTLKKCYQQPDAGTILSVVLGGRELREQRG